MLIYIGADHKGYALKEAIKNNLAQQGYQPQDVGNTENDPNDDYPKFAAAGGRSVQDSPTEARGIAICGSGAGADIVVNKFQGVRSVLGFSTDQVFDARRDDDVNVLALPASFVDEETANRIVKVFLTTPFSGEERHKRRITEITEIELKR